MVGFTPIQHPEAVHKEERGSPRTGEHQSHNPGWNGKDRWVHQKDAPRDEVLSEYFRQQKLDGELDGEQQLETSLEQLETSLEVKFHFTPDV